MADETRVVLVKPGDVLLIGNVTAESEAEVEALHVAFNSLRTILGLKSVVAFAADIDLAVVPADGDGA